MYAHRSCRSPAARRVLLLAALLALATPGLSSAQPHHLPPSPPHHPAALRAQLLYGEASTPRSASRFSLRDFTETAPADTSFASRPRDPWLAFDKVQHLTFSFLWTLGTQYALVNKVSLSEGRALPISIGASASVGLAKELYDWRVRPARFFSRRDLAADALGILLATGLILL